MQDAFKHLSAQQVARLIQYAEGGEGDEKPDGAQLHAEKNAPWVNGLYSHLKFPPYEFRAYPKWLYRAEYLKCDAEWKAAMARRIRRDDWAAVIKDAEDARADCMRLVQNQDEERLLGSGWFDSPQLAVEGQERLDRAVAQAAAESAYDDRNLGALAKAEREAADVASGGEHLVEVARTPVRKKF